jgi:hypothetical protein
MDRNKQTKTKKVLIIRVSIKTSDSSSIAKLKCGDKASETSME